MLRLERGSIFDGAIPDCATVALNRANILSATAAQVI